MASDRFHAAAMAFIFSFFVVGAGVAPGWAQERPLYVPGEALVKFHGAPARIAAIKKELGLEGIRSFKRIQLDQVKIASGLSVESVTARLRASGLVEYAEPNYYRYLDAVPNDPSFSQLWGMNNTGQTGGTADADIDAPEAWDSVTGDPNFVVAVIDSGMDMTHPDLAANVWTNPGEIPGNHIDDDGNGYIDDVHGWDFSGNDNDPSDTVSICGGHGTHVSGTIGAVGNNGVGVAGVNWNVKIMPLKIFKKTLLIYCSASDADIIAALNYAADKGVRVSNNSYGGGPSNPAVVSAIQAFKGLYIAAAGNDGKNIDLTPAYPASYTLSNIVSVAASDHNDTLATFSNFGTTSVDLSAPGVDVRSTLPGNTYGSYDGTSMATPHVVGAAAILWDQDPLATVNEIKWRLFHGVDPKGFPIATGGRLNLNHSLNLPSPDVIVDLQPVGSTTVLRGGHVGYKIVVTNQTAASKAVTLSIVAQLPNGSETPLQGPTIVTLNGGQTVSQSFTQVVPTTAPVGDYTLFGRAEIANVSFDEDPEDYTVN